MTRVRLMTMMDVRYIATALSMKLTKKISGRSLACINR